MHNHRVPLTLPIQALVRLLVELQAVIQAEPDDVMAAVLQVQAIAAGRRLHEQQVDIASVPRRLLIRALIDGYPQRQTGEGLKDPLPVVPEVIAYNRMLPVELFYGL